MTSKMLMQPRWAKAKWLTLTATICGLLSQAQTIKGTIASDAGTLPGATVSGKTFKKTVASDLQGTFTLVAPATGKAAITVSYMGFEAQTIELDLKAGVNDLGLIQLLPDTKGKLGAVVVKGTMAPSQAKAYSIKRNSNAIMDVLAADAIGKLPDRNAAEAVQRMQGVAVARYHGEADQAAVRGTPFAWTSTLFNSNRLPSSNVMGNRSSVLDVVPSEIIQYVQMAKAITPDMEGDAIGGSINFITRTAPAKRTLNVSGAGGYNTFSKNATYNGSLVYGDRFFKDKLGIIVAGAIWSRQWGSDEFVTSYNTGAATLQQKNSINTVLFKRYMGERQTKGLNVGAEYKITSSHKIFFRGMANKFDDIRPVYESYVDYTNTRFQYNYRYSHYQTTLNGGEIGGEHQLGSKFKLDWSYSNHQSKYFLETPPTTEGNKGLPIATFRQKITSGFSNLSSDGKRYWEFDSPNGVGGTPNNFQAGIKDANETISADKLLLSQMVVSQLDNSEHDQIGQLNLKIEASSKIRLKFGGKYRHKERESTFGSNFVFLPGAAAGVPNSPALRTLASLSTKSFPKGTSFFGNMDGNYNQFIVNPLTKEQLFDMFTPAFQTANGVINATSKSNITALYTGTENVSSGYAMAEIDATDNLKIIAGIRNEYTSMTLNGNKASTGAGGAVAISPSKVENNYNAFLPMLHAKYKLSEKANLRAAYTRTFVRPNFGDMTPGSSTNTTSSPMTISQGNPDLKPTFSNNFDLMGEYYFNNIGLLSGGVFYKAITDVIFTDISMQGVEGNDYLVTQAKNLNKANLFGLEAGINKRFDFLKGFWSGFGVELNYSYIHSSTEVARGTTTKVMDKTSLPNQSKHLFNAILFYERNGVMVRLAGNYRGNSVETINQQLGPDFYIWSAANFTIDASATVSITKRLKAFVELNNLSDAPVKMYMGDKRRITSNESYGRRGQAGIRWDIIK